jgi:hypothetical protein
LANATTPPDLWAMSQDPIQRVELLTAVVDQTIPSAASLAAAGPDLGAIPPPTARQPGDPRFEVNGTLQDVIETFAPDSRMQQTFMSRGWFVTRTALTTGVPAGWGPWEWSLTLNYRGTNLSDRGYRSAGILPGGFFDAQVTEAAAATGFQPVTSLQTFGPGLQAQVVKWIGNRAPILSPTVSVKPEIGTPVQFRSGVSDSDGQPVAVRWFIEDPTFSALRPSTAECSLNPPGRIDPLSGFAYTCPWRRIDDPGTGISYTYGRPGTWNVLVTAQDNDGAVSSEQFTVTVGNVAPTLTIFAYPFVVLPPQVPTTPEGQEFRIDGTVNFPGRLPDGTYSALTTLVVDWGDGEITQRAYPCTDGAVPSDRGCLIRLNPGFSSASSYVFAPNLNEPPLPDGPWPFTFTHTYVYKPGAFVNPATVKVYALTTLSGRSQTEIVSANIENIAPVFDAAYTCPFVADPLVLCFAGNRQEAPVGQPLRIDGRILDTPPAQHFVNVFWGDGTSSALTPGCTEPGCPLQTASFLPFPPVSNALPPKYLNIDHVYQNPGTYDVRVQVDDGGPNGRTVRSIGSRSAFGVSALLGPTEVQGTKSATYTYTSLVPPRGTVSVTPSCQDGQVTAQTASSFTCTFAAVAAQKASKVLLHAIIAGVTFDRSLDISIVPPPTTISAIAGPSTVTAGTTATYTYTETHASGAGLVFFMPTCGTAGAVQGGGAGAITCKFNDVAAATTTDVGITIAAPGGTATSTLPVTVLPDVTPPVLTLPGTIRANSTSNAGAIVPFSVSAVDAVSGPSQVIICSADSGTRFPIGTTTVTCSAGDWKNNTATGSFDVVVTDVTPPSLTLPASQTIDATGPGGAVAAFSATAADFAPAAPAVSCVPASGSTFKIGTTPVACGAVDAAGNRGSGQFTVTVRGASDQIKSLQAYIAGLPIDAATQKALLTALKAAASSVAANRRNACTELASVATLAQSAARARKLTAAQADRIVSDVNRIRAVLGC